jgi:hypothetical protein
MRFIVADVLSEATETEAKLRLYTREDARQARAGSKLVFDPNGAGLDKLR